MPVIVADLKRRKKALKLTTEQVAYMAELPVSTVSKIMTGETKNPSFVTVEKIDAVLTREEMRARVKAYMDAVNEYIRTHPGEPFDSDEFEKQYRIKNNLDERPIPHADPLGSCPTFTGNLAYKAKPELTVDDLADYSESRNVEMLDGHIIINEMPGMAHQNMVEKLGWIIKSYITDNKGKCHVYSSGVNVYLGEDDKTLLIPDIVVVCDDSRFSERGIEGPPDWIIEVTSGSTKDRDYKDKMFKYMQCMVKEYWVVDLDKEKVSVFIEGEPMMVYVYTFNDSIPVGIYDGKLEICING